MLKTVLTKIGKSSVTRPMAVQSNLAYSSAHGGEGDVNFYEMVEMFFDRAGKFFVNIYKLLDK